MERELANERRVTLVLSVIVACFLALLFGSAGCATTANASGPAVAPAHEVRTDPAPRTTPHDDVLSVYLVGIPIEASNGDEHLYSVVVSQPALVRLYTTSSSGVTMLNWERVVQEQDSGSVSLVSFSGQKTVDMTIAVAVPLERRDALRTLEPSTPFCFAHVGFMQLIGRVPLEAALAFKETTITPSDGGGARADVLQRRAALILAELEKLPHCE
ncbi:hypothetical protein HY480_01090 [Candidatus Uhrbacteria bacterium]|nr:hypothetical protein [Candidatus Uhrbacteria bacterium]